MTKRTNPPDYLVVIEAPANGRLRKAIVTVRDAEGKTRATDRGDLHSARERELVAGRLAQSLGDVKAEQLKKPLDEKWFELVDQQKLHREQVEAGSSEAAGHFTVELLDSSPPAIRRPLTLVNGHAYAAAWLPLKRTTNQAVDPKTGAVTRYDPPLVSVEDALIVLRDDGQAFTDAALPGARPIDELGLKVCLPATLPPGREWSGIGVKRFLAGERPDPADVFRRVASVFNRFLDFARGLAPQATLCEMVACYVLSSYFLDAFHVVGYFWPNGEAGSGKTIFLQTVTEQAYLGQLILAGSTYATLRDLADYGATLAFDDAEAVMDTRRTDPDKRTLLLAGNRRGATIAVKELEADKWVTRYVNAFCPRLFSAIRLPDTVLGSRSIIIPLVRSGDPGRTKADVLDSKDWPCDRRTLVDDLWALGLVHLPELAEHDRQAAESATLAGRALDPWRAILAVAHWLQEHGVAGLYDRMEKLSRNYQTERGEYEDADYTRVLYRALLQLTAGIEEQETVTIRPAEVAQAMNTIAKEENLVAHEHDGTEDEDEKAYITARRVGWLLKRQRFKRPRGRSEKGKQWKTTRREIEMSAKAYGVEEPEVTEESAEVHDSY